MHGLPDELGTLAPEESFLQAVPLSEIAQLMVGESCDVVESCVHILRARIADLTRLLRSGAIVIQLHLCAVTPDEHAVQAEISALRPWTINWSNVPDYIAPKAFHPLARACSVESTVHFMHSMNWPLSSFGASHIDFALRFDHAEYVSWARRTVGMCHTIIAAAYMCYALGTTLPLLAPPVEDIRNILDYPCFQHTYKPWTSAFLAAGELKHEHQAITPTRPVYSPLNRSNATICLAFTYNLNVRLRPTRDCAQLPPPNRLCAACRERDASAADEAVKRSHCRLTLSTVSSVSEHPISEYVRQSAAN
jgi:hypothetical protein